MKKIKLYIATSINGKIATSDGGVAWLDKFSNPADGDYGYAAFQSSIDTTIQGYNTYQQILDWGIEFPYQKTKNYVLTRKQDVVDTKDVEFINENPIEKIKALKQETGKDIWLIGGGSVNTLLLNEGLVDEIHVFVMPVVLPEGIGVVGVLPTEVSLKLKSSQSYESGAVGLVYEVR